MANKNLLKKFREYDSTKPQIVKEIAGLLGVPINGSLTVEVPNRNGFVYVRLRNNTNELIQAFNEKVSPVYGLPVLVKWNVNRYEIVSRDTNRYQDWGSFSSFLPRHGSQHSLNFDDGQGGDVTWIYSRQVMPFATVPSGTEGAGTVFVMPHVYRNPMDASWNYIGNESSPSFLPAKPTGTSARMMLLVWNLESGDPLIVTGTHLSENLTGTFSVLSAIPTITNQNYVPLAAIRLVSGTQSILWDNIYDMRQWAVTTPPAFQGGFAVWDEGVPQGTGTILDFVGANVQASVSGSVVRVYVTGSFSGASQLGILGQDEGVNRGTGTVLNVMGQRATLNISGTVLNLNISPDPAELIGIMGWDDGTPKGTGTVIDFGNNLTASLSGTVLRIDASGGSANPPITGSVVIQDDGANQGSALVLNFGSNLTASVSGNTAQINVTNVPAPVNTDGVMVWDEGIPLGTGSIFNFVGSNVEASISGSVVRVFVTGSSGGGDFFGIKTFTDPPSAGWSWDNQGSGTIDSSYGYEYLYVGHLSAVRLTTRYRTPSNSHYSIRAFFMFDFAGTLRGIGTAADAGILFGFRDNAGKYVIFLIYNEGGLIKVATYKWNSSSSANSTYKTHNSSLLPTYISKYLWLRVDYDGTNINFYQSIDGNHWELFDTRALTNFLAAGTPDVAWGAYCNASPVAVSLISYEEVALP